MDAYELMEQSILKNLQELSETCVSDFHVDNYYDLVDLFYDLWNIRAILIQKNKKLYNEIKEETLFDKFIKQYVEDLIECSDTEYDLTEEDKKDIIERVCDNDRVWETLDNIIFDYLYDYRKECEE